MKNNLLTGFVKITVLFAVLALLIGHGSRTGPIVNELPPPKPCQGLFRLNVSYTCIDAENTQNDIQTIAGKTVINGDLIIYNTSLTDLNFLSSITRINGRLAIVQNAALTSIAPNAVLNQLTSLYIKENPRLTHLQGFTNLQSIPDEVTIVKNTALTTLAGVNVGTSAKRIDISENTSLQDLAALRNLNQVDFVISISRNNLRNLSELTRLQSAGSLLVGEDKITDLSTLANLQTLRGTLAIVGCSNLKNLAGLSNLNSYMGLKISDNPLLTSLNGAPFIPSTLSELVITKNDALSDIQILRALTSVKTVDISYNPSLTSLSVLANLQRVDKLDVKNNDQLTSLGMNALRRVELRYYMVYNKSLCQQDVINLLNQVRSRDGIGPYATDRDIFYSGNKRC